MDKFDEKNIPFTVAVIDMDWHRLMWTLNTEAAGQDILGTKSFS